MRLIDADGLHVSVLGGRHNGKMLAMGLVAEAVEKLIAEAPTVEAEPVRHGKWKRWDEDDYGDTYECTSCGEAFVMLEGSPIENGYHYCPYCGAKMDERKEE